jgi:hypothetical protein
MRRAPLAPNGYQIAMAPPFTLVFTRSAPVSWAHASVVFGVLGLTPCVGGAYGDVVHTHSLGASEASKDRFGWLPARDVSERRVGAVRSEPSPPPCHEGHRHVVEIAALFGEFVFMANRPVLVWHPSKKADLDKATHSVRQDVRGDAEALLELVESPCTEKAFADD